MKAAEWIKDALLEIGVQAASQSVSPDKFQSGIRYANRLMSSHDNLGLGYTELSNANDEVTIPPYAEEWAVYALAVRLNTQFGPNQDIVELKDKERTAYRQMLKHIDIDMSVSYPSILPTGSGNGYFNNFYHGGGDNYLLTEQGDYILTEGE